MTSWSRPRHRFRQALAAGAIAAACLHAAPLAAQAPLGPIPAQEELRYSVYWPSGLSFGTAEFRARFTDPGWRFEFELQASLPRIEINDRVVSRADSQMCGQEFEKHILHGSKRANELLRFRPNVVERINLQRAEESRPSVIPVQDCARDALAFLYFLRTELAAGRIPPPSTVFFGAGYRIRLEHSQTRWLTWDGERQLTDEIRVSVRGPASEHELSAYFGRDDSRAPLLFQMQFDADRFTMRLQE